MTDDEINRLVAERVMGLSVYHYDKDYAANCYYMLIDRELNPVAAFDGWHTGERKTEAEAWADAPDVVNDPAAWGALFEHLTRAGRMPSLEGYSNFGYTAEVCPEGSDHGTPINDPIPGRALALAALRAHGVTP